MIKRRPTELSLITFITAFDKAVTNIMPTQIFKKGLSTSSDESKLSSNITLGCDDGQPITKVETLKLGLPLGNLMIIIFPYLLNIYWIHIRLLLAKH